MTSNQASFHIKPRPNNNVQHEQNMLTNTKSIRPEDFDALRAMRLIKPPVMSEGKLEMLPGRVE